MDNRRGDNWADRISRSEKRRLRARSRGKCGPWFGLGMMGMIGWSVIIPTLVCTAIGAWIDRRTESQYSWTLMLMLFGLVVGCLNAWYWVRKECPHE